MFSEWLPPGDAQQTIDQRVNLTGNGFQSAEGGDGALTWIALIVAISFDELNVTAWAGFSDLDIHAATLSPVSYNYQYIKI